MKVTLAIASLLPFLAAAGPVDPSTVRTVYAPNENPPSGAVKIRAVTYGGTGCPQGTVGAIISQDASTVTLIFDEYAAQTGPKFQPAATRKNCQLNFALTYPGGFQYSVLAADYRGYADIDKGVTGTLKSTYYFSGSAQQTSTEANFVGPMVGDYVKHDEIENTSTVWSPCGAEGMLNINSQVRLQANDNKASGLLTTDSIDAKFVQKLSVQWRKCNSGGGSNSPAPAPPASQPAPPKAPPANNPPPYEPEEEEEEEDVEAPSPSGPINVPSVTTTPSRPGSQPSFGNSGNSNSGNRGNSGSSSNSGNRGNSGSSNSGSSSSGGRNNGNSGFGGLGNTGGFGGFPGSTTTGQSDSFQLNNPNANPWARPSQPAASWNSGSTTISWSG